MHDNNSISKGSSNFIVSEVRMRVEKMWEFPKGGCPSLLTPWFLLPTANSPFLERKRGNSTVYHMIDRNITLCLHLILSFKIRVPHHIHRGCDDFDSCFLLSEQTQIGRWETQPVSWRGCPVWHAAMAPLLSLICPVCLPQSLVFTTRNQIWASYLFLFYFISFIFVGLFFILPWQIQSMQSWFFNLAWLE